MDRTMKFSWARFVREYRIDFVTEGPSTARGNLYIHCPFCGPSDEHHHMGLSLNAREPYYGCWKNASHRGRYPARLITALIDCTWEQARAIIEAEDSSAVDEYEATVARTLALPAVEPEAVPPNELRMPLEFHALGGRHAGTLPFLKYLEARGFDALERMAKFYDLRYCRQGYFSWRVLLPIYVEGRLVNWTGRDITGRAALRYKTLSERPETASKQGYPPAPAAIGSTVFNQDHAASGGRTLVICEGPFDALKIDWFADEDDAAVAIFGMPKSAQLSVIVRLARKFERVRIVLDAAASSASKRLCNELEPVLGQKVRWLDLPAKVKDPGALDADEVRALLAR
jgi:hypothetical protein